MGRLHLLLLQEQHITQQSDNLARRPLFAWRRVANGLPRIVDDKQEAINRQNWFSCNLARTQANLHRIWSHERIKEFF